MPPPTMYDKPKKKTRKLLSELTWTLIIYLTIAIGIAIMFMLMTRYHLIIGTKVNPEDRFFVLFIGIGLPVFIGIPAAVVLLIHNLLSKMPSYPLDIIELYKNNQKEILLGVARVVVPFILSSIGTNYLLILFHGSLKENLLLWFFVGFILFIIIMVGISFFFPVERSQIIEPLIIVRTPRCPSVFCDARKRKIDIKGRILDGVSSPFFNPLEDWIKNYTKTKPSRLTVNITLEYFSTDCVCGLLNLFHQLKYAYRNNKKRLIINWYYEDDDEDMLEYGKNFEEIIKVPFNVIRFRE